MIGKGTQVTIRQHRSKPQQGLSYEARTGVLAEDCNGEGWDVVELTDGTSVYSFSVERADTRDDENAAKLQEIGKRAHAALAEMVAALECDYDRLDELLEQNEADLSPEDAAELKELYDATFQGECKSRDDAEQRIHEDPLSIEVRGDWYAPGDEDKGGAPSEFNILLGTGGPAVRIIGELDANCEPKSARLQTQDWFLPWTDYVGQGGRAGIQETLLTYCRCFYFGEG